MISVNELTAQEIPFLTDYWTKSSPEHITRMGADINKLPSPDEFRTMLNTAIRTPIEKRGSFCLIWFEGERAIGHCNTNPTEFGKEAFMHLHLWNDSDRGKGYGQQAVELCIPILFERLKLQLLHSQPKADNKAANSVLKKCGFQFVKNHICIPGSINYEQEVSLWTIKGPSV